MAVLAFFSLVRDGRGSRQDQECPERSEMANVQPQNTGRGFRNRGGRKWLFFHTARLLLGN